MFQFSPIASVQILEKGLSSHKDTFNFAINQFFAAKFKLEVCYSFGTGMKTN